MLVCLGENTYNFYFGLMSAWISVLVSHSCEGLKLSDTGGDTFTSTEKDREKLYERSNNKFWGYNAFNKHGS